MSSESSVETEGPVKGSAGRSPSKLQLPPGLEPPDRRTVSRFPRVSNRTHRRERACENSRYRPPAIASNLYNFRVIRVLLFAALRDAAGRDCIELPAQPQDTARSLWDRLRSDCPALDSFTARTRVAVNGKYASWEAEVHPGDEVVFFPPVSGGVR